MLTIQCDAVGIARTRVAVSPAHEMVGWLVRGILNRPHPTLGGLRATVASASSDPDIRHLVQAMDTAIHRRSVPSFLAPVGGEVVGGRLDIVDQLEQIAGVSAEQLTKDLYPPQERTSPSESRGFVAMSIRCNDDPVARQVAHRFARGMSKFWRRVVQPQWSVLSTSLSVSARCLASTWMSHGMQGVFGSLGCEIAWSDSALTVNLDGPSEVHRLAGRPILLIPSTLTPRPIVDICQTPTPWLAVPTGVHPSEGRLTAELVGSTRSRLLNALAEPRTTTDLSTYLGVSLATVSYHLGVLSRAGMVERSRQGKRVWYVRRTSA